MSEVHIVRLRKLSRSAYISIPPAVVTRMRLNLGDMLGLRVVAGKMILERVPVERIAKVSIDEVSGDAS